MAIEAIQIDGTMYRRRKVLNIGGAKVQNIGGGGGAQLFAGCKLIGAPPPVSANNYISHIDN